MVFPSADDDEPWSICEKQNKTKQNKKKKKTHTHKENNVIRFKQNHYQVVVVAWCDFFKRNFNFIW